MSRTRFINVDLDVYSTKSLKGLANAMERAGAITLHCGRMAPGKYRASFELGLSPRSADTAIRGLVRLVQGLPPPAVKHWEAATLRDFAVGIDTGHRPFSLTSAIKPTTVAAVANLRAQISYVIYSLQEK